MFIHIHSVIPAKAGIQSMAPISANGNLDSGLRRNDGGRSDLCRFIHDL